MRLEELVTILGLPGIAIGAGVEGEAVTFFGGMMAHRGLYPVEGAALAASLGAAVSDEAMFLLGRYGSRTALVDRLLSRPTVARLRQWLESHPTGFILSFRFVYGIKVASAILLGTTSVPWLRFAVLDAIAVLVWAHVITWLGYSAGITIERIFGHLSPHLHMRVAVGIAVAIAVALSVGWHVWKRRSRP